MKIAFYKAYQPKARWYDKLIAWWTNGVYSHCELIIDGYMYSTSPRDECVRKKMHHKNHLVWDYVDIDLLDSRAIDKFYRLTDGAKYDWLGVFGFVIPFKDSSRRWFCSEWCSNALKICGYEPLFDKNPSKISPNKLYAIIKSYKNKNK